MDGTNIIILIIMIILLLIIILIILLIINSNHFCLFSSFPSVVGLDELFFPATGTFVLFAVSNLLLFF